MEGGIGEIKNICRIEKRIVQGPKRGHSVPSAFVKEMVGEPPVSHGLSPSGGRYDSYA